MATPRAPFFQGRYEEGELVEVFLMVEANGPTGWRENVVAVTPAQFSALMEGARSRLWWRIEQEIT